MEYINKIEELYLNSFPEAERFPFWILEKASKENNSDLYAIIDNDKFNFLWVVDWPLFEYDEEENRYVAAHHPFTSPKDGDEDKLLTDPASAHAKAYDIVLNGYELGGGSIRIHNQETQAKMFKAIGLSEEEIKGDLIFDNVSYSHNGVNNIFERVSFKINYGSKFLIYGESGYGKSSIMKILLKYLEDYKGNILIDGVDIKDIDSSVIQNSFTYVSQNSYLINDTLKNNILYDRNISEKDYSEIVKLCNLEKLIHSKPNRGEFIIEDNGFNISGGERQKIILARSLLKESNFIILDEALSEVDFFEEKEILNRIFEKYSDKTIIYISHKKEIIDMFYEKYKLERRNRS